MDGVGYRNTRSYENLERRLFSGVGSYGISQAEGVRRAASLMSGNTDAQQRKYIKKYGQ